MCVCVYIYITFFLSPLSHFFDYFSKFLSFSIPPPTLKPFSHFSPCPFHHISSSHLLSSLAPHPTIECIPPRYLGTQVGDGDTLTVGNMVISVLFTPCHTPGHVTYVLEPTDGSPKCLVQTPSISTLKDSNISRRLNHLTCHSLSLCPLGAQGPEPQRFASSRETHCSWGAAATSTLGRPNRCTTLL